MNDPVELAQNLIRCPSVTPKDAGAIGVVEAALKPLGFACTRLAFGEGSARVENLYARLGDGAPNLCFAGHTDVVPPGDGWRHDPFGGVIEDGVLYGRGAADMKSGVAAFVAAVARYLAKNKPAGSISLLITGDEEGLSINGTKKVLEWMRENGERIDHCIVGEPTASTDAADTIKIGRRGSMRIAITVRGRQGHTAYPQLALNPIPVLAAIVTRLGEPLDKGSEHFEPSTLVFTTFDVGNPASNVSPGEARAVCNIRFNDLHSAEKLTQHVTRACTEVTTAMGGEFALDTLVGGVSFVTQPGAFTDMLSKTIARVTNATPQFSTGGGTSDARFIKDHCPVAEIGLPGGTMHKTDECMPVAQIERLTGIYEAILESYFANPPK
ncbi:MAG TPA: succinyl-diaminopimelate desuccinylase [Rhizomicrobium sp.]|jgi:succinyl-diaminopimelate desuccinylase|nr:succinyl-diaminopimelate desuccinylase [Rhizomicrobium sp.]